MIAKFIYNNFDKDAIMTIEFKASKYIRTKPSVNGGGYCLDEGTMIKILMDEVDPSTIVGTKNFPQQIQNARLPKFGYNGKLGLEHIEHCHKDIQTCGETLTLTL